MASVFHPSLLLLMFLLPCSVMAQTSSGTITIGSSLTAGDAKASPWLSPNKDFAFGFRQLDGEEDLYVLAIWFYKTPNQLDNIVWYPKDKAPAPKGSKVKLNADRGFVLTNPKTGLELWQSGASIGSVTAGFLNDTGNLVVSGSKSEHLWQSFEDPADTILPGQVLRKGGPLLSSRRSQTNFSLGRYQMRLQADGNLLMNSINLPTRYKYDAYYYTGTIDGVGSLLVFNESGTVYLSLANNSRIQFSPVSARPTENYLRGSLSFYGIFTMFSYPKNSNASTNWSPLWSIPDNICTSLGGGLQGLNTGPCGFNSVCRQSNHRVVCNCPPNFSLLDMNDPYGGCKPDYELSCKEDVIKNPEEAYDFVLIADIDWIASDYERLEPSTEEGCKSSCLQDCLCAAAVFRGTTCNKKRMPLSYGGEDLGKGIRAFIKVWKDRGNGFV